MHQSYFEDSNWLQAVADLVSPFQGNQGCKFIAHSHRNFGHAVVSNH